MLLVSLEHIFYPKSQPFLSIITYFKNFVQCIWGLSLKAWGPSNDGVTNSAILLKWRAKDFPAKVMCFVK